MLEKYRFISENYKGLNFLERLFILARWLTAPLNQVEKLCPQKGEILDIGCSSGILAVFLTARNKGRVVSGLDPSEEKIKLANKGMTKGGNPSFKAGFLENLKFNKKFDAILLVDVSYLLAKNKKIQILSKAAKLLKRSGILIVSTIDNDVSLGYWLSYFQEIISVKVLKITYSEDRQLYFGNLKEYKQIFNQTSLKLTKMIKTKTFFYPYRIFVLTK